MSETMAPIFEEVGRVWLASLTERKSRRTGKKRAARTLRIYADNLKRLNERFGQERLPLANRVIRDYIAAMHEAKYSDSQILGDLTVAKLVSKFERDPQTGDPLYALQLDAEYCDVPILDPEERNAPCATAAQIESALAMGGELAGLIAICAGAGLRISEALSLHVEDGHGSEDAFDPDAAAIQIRRTKKTKNAERTVYIPQELNVFVVDWLRAQNIVAPGQRIFSTTRSDFYHQIERAGLPPFHSYRRFFASWRDECGMNRLVLKELLGHSKNGDITDRYAWATDVNKANFVRAEVERCGLGFVLPTIRPVALKPAEPIEAVAALVSSQA